VDIVGPRAIPALIALAIAFAAFDAHGACEALDGKYKVRPVDASGERAPTLATLAEGPDRAKLFGSVPGAAPAQGGLDSTQVRSRRSNTMLAQAAVLKSDAKGAQLEFFDGKGGALAKLRLAAGWKCAWTRFTHADEHLVGLGNAIRTERVEEVLSKDASGRLAYEETVTSIDPPAKPKKSGAFFAPAP
jgi:hypothetical protein